MDAVAIGRMLLLYRLRSGKRQSDVAAPARLSTAAVRRHEHGRMSSVERLRRHAEALGLRLDLQLRGRGGEMDRLADDEHAAIVETMAALLRQCGRTVEPEVSYNEWGERGRFDLLAYHGRAGVVEVTEAKGELTDLQEMLGTLGTKARLALPVARQRGWRASRTSVLLAVAATPRNRRIVDSPPNLFGGFEQQQVSARSVCDVSTVRLLLWVPAARAGRRHWIAGRRRIRRQTRDVAARGSTQGST